MRTECDRGGQRWYAREVLAPKDESWMFEIAKECLQVRIQLILISSLLYSLLCVVCGVSQGS